MLFVTPRETELSDWRTLEAPEQKDIQLVQIWDVNRFGQHELLNLYLAVGQMEGCQQVNGDQKYK